MIIGPVNIYTFIGIALLVCGMALCFRPLLGILLIACGLMLIIGKIDLNVYNDTDGFSFSAKIYRKKMR